MKQILFAIGIVCTMQSCIKDYKTTITPPPIEGLPEATQVGAHTFGCMVGGVVASTNKRPTFLDGKGVKYSIGTDSVLVVYAITENPRKDFYLTADLKGGVIGTHVANIPIGAGPSSMNIEGGAAPLGSNYYTAVDSLPATITITKYTATTNAAKLGTIICGTFDFVMVNSAGIKVHLTSGRFDLKQD